MRRGAGLVGVLTFGVLTSVTAVSLGAAHGAPDPRPRTASRVWTRVTDGTDTRSTDEVGLARTDDGVLHVLWRARPAAGSEEIRHTAVAPDGEVGESVTASGPVASAGNPAVVVTDDGGLRIFYAGLTGSQSALDGVLSASSDESAETWTTDATRVSSTTSAIPEGVGAAVAPDGTPAFVYAHSFVLGYHLGLDPAVADVDLVAGTDCCAYLPNLAFNASEGIAAWYSNVDGQVGYHVQTVFPELGTPLPAPVKASVASEGSVTPNQRTALVTRAGSEEIHLAYCSGYPSCTEVLVWEVGGDAPVVVAEGGDIEKVALATDPDGRLWALWQDVTAGKLMASRSNDDATEFGAPVAFDVAHGTESVWHLAGDATDEHLDVVASLTVDRHVDAWHTSVLPGLGVDVKTTKQGTTFTVTDAGEPVKGATVTFRKKTPATNATGVAKAPAGRGTATVTAKGYTATAVTVG